MCCSGVHGRAAKCREWGRSGANMRRVIVGFCPYLAKIDSHKWGTGHEWGPSGVTTQEVGLQVGSIMLAE